MYSISIELSESEILATFQHALQKGMLEEKFFYWLPWSVQAWIDLCNSTEYKNANRTLEILKRNGPDIAQIVVPKESSGTLTYFAMGPGDGKKDRVVLEELKKYWGFIHFQAVDASQMMLEIALEEVRDSINTFQGVKADMLRPGFLTEMRKNMGSGPVVYSLLGNTFGIAPEQFSIELGDLLQQYPNDYLLADGEIFQPGTTMAGYDNPINRKFAFAPLQSVGIGESDGELRFFLDESRKAEGFWQVKKEFEFTQDLEINFGGYSQIIQGGDLLKMSGSTKYSANKLEELLVPPGLQATRFESTDGLMRLYLTSRGDSPA